ncbi:MAG: hypothetical protein HRT87_06920 [Legionellales bacterium]|nr:hypothetical protein [Legionellales bacterium]
MDYRKLATDSFHEALIYYRHLHSKASVTEFEHKQLELMCRDFFNHFNKWMTYSRFAATDFLVYVKSTDLADILTLPESEWSGWIKKSLRKEKATV